MRVQPSGEKYSYFVFTEIVFVYAHPASARGALRAIVTTREAGCGGRDGSQHAIFSHADERDHCGREIVRS
jgi:hypothetical protein